ncbi:putative UDP-rhamnose:rhamnosyltransferase 1 [Camellia lanceoleosa]|uniref:UDP-rhamnose:rhamnosyltransferase 1 n=1 Tax=Camellia lanceoleosa TaxID=1840588 RepID=A0ACC0HX06_9ERIC|nr:putative UDP-rhamnose:rhamnosyltransferase 1 [Camellia lanceoleosa]
MTNDGKQKLHIVVFPWLAFGHMIPFLELAKNMARRGHQVSFLSTPRNIERLPRIPPNLSPLISLVKLHLPPVDGLPDNAEATIDLPSDKIHFLKKAYDGLKDELTQFLQASSPDWVVYDFAPYWLPPIAAELGISRAFFNAVNAWFLAFLGPPSALIGSIHGQNGKTLRSHLNGSRLLPTWPTGITRSSGSWRPHKTLPQMFWTRIDLGPQLLGATSLPHVIVKSSKPTG